jgi:nitrate/nitrite transport system substrate-binding protein
LKYCKWFLSQFRRWGLLAPTSDAPIDYDGIAQKVMRPELYEEAMQEIGYEHGGANNDPETLFDGVTFDPAKPEEYALSFEIHNRK